MKKPGFTAHLYWIINLVIIKKSAWIALSNSAAVGEIGVGGQCLITNQVGLYLVKIHSKLSHFELSGHFGEGVWVIIGNFGAAIGTLASTRILAEYLGVNNFGIYSLANTLALLICQTVFNPPFFAIVRQWAIYEERDKRAAFVQAIYNLSVKLTFLVFGIVFISLLFILKYFPTKVPLFLLSVIYSLSWGYYAILRSVELASRQRKIAAIHQGALPWMQILISCLAMYYMGSYPEIVMVGFSIGTLAIFASQLLSLRAFLRKQGGTKNEVILSEVKEIQRCLIKFALPFATWAAISSLQISSGRWALESFYNEEAVAYFSVLYQFGYQSMVLVGYMLIQFASPIIYQRAGDAKDSRRLDDAKRFVMILIVALLVLSIVCILITAVFQNQIFRLIAPKEYWHTAHLLIPIMIASTFFNLSEVVAILPLLHSDSKSLMLPKIGSALIGCFIMVGLVGNYGLNGAVTGTVLYATGYLFWVSMVTVRNNYYKLAASQLISQIAC